MTNPDPKMTARLRQLTEESERIRFRDELATAAEYSAALHNRLMKLLEHSITEPADAMRQELEACSMIIDELSARLDVQTVRTLIMQALT